MNKIIIYCDGAARGNPGPAGAGAVLLNEHGEVIAELSKYLGETTNNQAEYRALLLALEEVDIFSDSELLVRQINGEYRVKNDGLKPIFKLALSKLKVFAKYKLKYIPRAQNAHADRLANRAIDEKAL